MTWVFQKLFLIEVISLNFILKQLILYSKETWGTKMNCLKNGISVRSSSFVLARISCHNLQVHGKLAVCLLPDQIQNHKIRPLVWWEIKCKKTCFLKKILPKISGAPLWVWNKHWMLLWEMPWGLSKNWGFFWMTGSTV